MKKENVIALCLGLLVAGLLWQYYLKPMYDKKTGNEAVMEALRQADVKALEEATAKVEGDLIYRSDQDTKTGFDAPAPEAGPDYIGKEGGDHFDFHSAANRPPSLYEMAASGDKRKETKIVLEDDDAVLKPRIAAPVPAPGTETAAQDIPAGDDIKGRFTMITAPVKHIVYKDAVAYGAFRKASKAKYPDVNFKKDMIVFLESDSSLSNGFFSIADNPDIGEKIVINYKVNIIGNSQRPDIMAYKIIPKSDKLIVLNQVK